VGERDARGAYRRNAVILLGSAGSAVAVADALLMDPDSVRDDFKHYRAGGIDGLLRMNYVGSEALLSPAQLAKLDTHLKAHFYLAADALVWWLNE
jgi:hypothetical protein